MKQNSQIKYGSEIFRKDYSNNGKRIPHPDFEEIEDFSDGKLKIIDTLGMLEHLSRCSECCESLCIIREQSDLVNKLLQETPKKLPVRLQNYFKEYLKQNTNKNQ